jgi:DNA (cytosine-5)-methyltransferase 1
VRPRLLDLFCGAGGAAMGYHRAGFDVVGVDIEPQPHYPFEFHRDDAIAMLRHPWGDHFHYLAENFDAIHASPPCKHFTKTGWAYKYDYHADHDDLLTPCRELLEKTGLPWVIENVPGAPMRKDVMLCGSQFGLNVRRHRLFEFSDPPFQLMAPCVHDSHVVSPHGNPNAAKGSGKDWAAAMGIDWMTAPELAQAIPPAYSTWIGAQLLRHLSVSAAPPIQEKP